MKIVGYHYIRKFSSEYQNSNGIRFLHIKDFRKQLDFFKKNFYLPSLEEFLSFKNGTLNLPSDSIILSFDDGLTDHYKYVFPELINRGMWGIFFIPTRPYIYNKHIGTFALHHLLGKVNSIKLIENIKFIFDNSQIELNVNLNKININLLDLNSEEKRTLFLKKLINSRNYFKTEESKDILIDQLLKKYIPELNLFDVYLKPEEIIEMEKSGMIIGAHSITHNYMSDLDDDNQFYEIDSSFKVINSITSKLKYKFFGYPYGKLNTINSKTLEILEKLNVDAAFLFNEEKINLDFCIYDSFNKFLIPRMRPDYFQFGENFKY